MPAPVRSSAGTTQSAPTGLIVIDDAASGSRDTADHGGARDLSGDEPGRAARTFRLFVSSTFDDFELERDILRERVWPRLERFCEQRGARFEAVDLRWGVSAEAACRPADHEHLPGRDRALPRVTPRPNFLVLLGDHYGWRPLPPQIPAEEFDALAAIWRPGTGLLARGTWLRAR